MHRLNRTCSHCSRSFKRAEHLTRHLRTHTREKPYSCRCGAAFTRRDLLTRHWRITEHAGSANVNETRPSSAIVSIDSSRLPESLHVPQIGSNEVHVNGTGDINAQLLAQIPQRHVNVQAPVAPLQDPHGPFIDPGLDHASYNDDGFDEFRDFVNFIDGVGLSAQWTPEYDFDWMRFGEQHQDSRRHSQEPDNRHSSGPEDIGTPFSTWLPSAPADDQVHLASNVGDDVRERRTRSGTYHVTDDHRKFLVSLVESLPPSLSALEIPSRHTLTRYITAFFGGFHSHFPFIHAPTYKPSCWFALHLLTNLLIVSSSFAAPLELTLAMCAAGAQYCFERRSSERLFRAAKGIVFERLRQEPSHFSPQSLAFAASRWTTQDEETSSRRSGPWSPLDLVKTTLILVGFATWERKDLLQEAFILRGLLVQTLRDVGLKEEQASKDGSTSRSAMWDQWLQRESSRRTKLVAFCYVNVHTIAYNNQPLLWSSELDLRLPCCTPEWEAPSAAQWAALQRDEREDQMHFQRALSILLQGTTGIDSVHPIPSPIGNYILLHALLQRIHIVRELSFPSSSPIALPSTELELISRALRSWTSLWQQTPESILDPNNESGPIPFTSSALLVVAYVRLSLNVGPHRHLDARDAAVTAAGLSKLPPIERNENLLSALLYSTHALSIPVRLGIDRVARSQAFFWSVQHAISSFECAVFLGKWLCDIPRPFREADLSRSEYRILHWVRCIIKEAYAVMDFDDAGDEGRDVPTQPFELGCAVLGIWRRFFGGNTQWSFVVGLGESLDGFVKRLE